ncbi:hypothetical protein [Shewanella sp. ENK2]|uniref:hypothetical protein n=1 Tax=Shewanella sp. ENK2 TaxID=2775245 RepID=UPI003749429E
MLVPRKSIAKYFVPVIGALNAMKNIALLLTLLLPVSVLAEECSTEKVKQLKDKLSNKSLGKPGGHGKLPKLTDHDYPIKCSINHNGQVFTWYTDSDESHYIIRIQSGEKSEYFGVFKSVI